MTDRPLHRRWLRFRLRTLLLFMAVVAVPLAWIARERRQSIHEATVAAALRPMGFAYVEIGGPYDSGTLRQLRDRQGAWARFARRVLGERIVLVHEPPRDFADAAPFATLASLQYLDLSNSAVADLAALGCLKELRWLHLDDTPVKDLGPLVDLARLEALSLTRTSVMDLAPLGGLRQLRTLYLNETEVSDISPLVRLEHLHSLGLRNTRVREFSPLAALKSLETLDLRGLPITDLTPLSGLVNLQRLGLEGTQVKDLSPISELKQLEALVLQRTRVSDLTPLAGLSKLRHLLMKETPVTKAEVDALQQALPNCKIEHDPFPEPSASSRSSGPCP